MASKKIVVTTEVYEMLRRQKMPGESFNNLVRRLAAGKGKLSTHLGALAGEPADFFQEMERVIAAVDGAFALELRSSGKRRKGWET